MKARVKATGEIVDVVKSSFTTKIYDINGVKRTLDCITYRGAIKNYREDELEFNVNYDPDYWTRLEHQYAGMAMQGMLTNPKLCDVETPTSLASTAATIANALVEKLKEEEKK